MDELQLLDRAFMRIVVPLELRKLGLALSLQWGIYLDGTNKHS